MKKIVLFLFVAIATLSVKAQDLYMGGTVGLWRGSGDRIQPERTMGIGR